MLRRMKVIYLLDVEAQDLTDCLDELRETISEVGAMERCISRREAMVAASTAKGQFQKLR